MTSPELAALLIGLGLGYCPGIHRAIAVIRQAKQTNDQAMVALARCQELIAEMKARL